MVHAGASKRRPGPARGLSREQIAEAGLTILRTEGIDAVSFRSVSRQLGVNPMALYTYVADKQEMLAAMFDEVMRKLDTSALTASDRSAPEKIVEFFVGVRRLFMRYADLHRVARPSSVSGFDWAAAERIYAAFGELGLTPGETARVYLTILQFTVGNAMYGDAAPDPGRDDNARFDLSDLDARQHPVTHAVLREYQKIEPEVHFRSTLKELLRVQAVGR